MNQASKWVIEYSHSEGSYRISKTAEMLRRNISSIRNEQPVDYICVGIFATKELALEAILEFRRNRVPGHTIDMLL